MTKEEEWKRLGALIEETKRVKRIADAQMEFESFQRRLKHMESDKSRSRSKPRLKPLPEEVAIASGLLHVSKCKEVS